MDGYVGRGGDKLAWALERFGVRPEGWTAADLGANVGGFTDALLRAGARRVYAVDTGYGTLAWTLRQDPRVVVMERTNALHAILPEPVDLVASDVGWTRQEKILPRALALLARPGTGIAADPLVLSLVKPQYEARPGEMVPGRGRVKPEACQRIAAAIRGLAERLCPGRCEGPDETPFLGGKGKNPEYFLCLRTGHKPRNMGISPGSAVTGP